MSTAGADAALVEDLKPRRESAYRLQKLGLEQS
jgi:hypothetical protein